MLIMLRERILTSRDGRKRDWTTTYRDRWLRGPCLAIGVPVAIQYLQLGKCLCFQSQRNERACEDRYISFCDCSREGGSSRPDVGSLPVTTNTQIMEKYCELLRRIDNSNRTFGKDGKFQRFICLSVRYVANKRVTVILVSTITWPFFCQRSHTAQNVDSPGSIQTDPGNVRG